MRLSDYADLLRKIKCPDCGFQFDPRSLEHYDHPGGWKVDGYTKRQWLYVECRPCKYQWSFTKLNVPGKASYEEQKQEEARMGAY